MYLLQLLTLLPFALLNLDGVAAKPAPSLPVHPGVGGFYRGPNSETIIRGPDGSVITAAAAGGEVHTKLDPIVVAEPAVAPVVTPGPSVVQTVEINAAGVQPTSPNSDLVGPSGTISTRGPNSIVAGPASTTITGPIVGNAVVQGPPIIGTPSSAGVVDNSGPIFAVTEIPTLIATGSPASIINIAPPASVTRTPYVAIQDTPIISGSVVPNASFVTGTDAPHVAPSQIGQRVVSPQAVASASFSPNLSVATASSSSAATVTAVAAANHAAASVQTSGPSHDLPIQISPTIGPHSQVSSTLGPVITINGDPGVNTGIVGISDRIDLGSYSDQVILTNSQLIPSANIIPPEIRLAASQKKQIVGSPVTISSTTSTPPPVSVQSPTLEPRTLSLGPVVSSTVAPPSIQQEAGTYGIVNPSSDRGLEIVGRLGPFETQLISTDDLQSLQAIADARFPAQLHEALPNEINLSQEGYAGLFEPNPTVVSVTPRNLDSSHLVRAGPTLSTAEEQQLLNTHLSKAGVEASVVQVVNIPLDSLTPLKPSLEWASPGTLTAQETWHRYNRQTEKNNKN